MQAGRQKDKHPLHFNGVTAYYSWMLLVRHLSVPTVPAYPGSKAYPGDLIPCAVAADAEIGLQVARPVVELLAVKSL